MLAYIQNRLAEHSTQLALSGVLTSVMAAASGQVSWSVVGAAAVGSLPAILFPSSSAK